MRVVNSSNTPSFYRHYTNINHENSLYLVHTYGTIIVYEFLILPNDGRQVPLSFTKKKQHSERVRYFYENGVVILADLE